MRGFDGAYSFGSYEGTLRDLIRIFKYSGIKPLARQLGELLCRALPARLLVEKIDAVVPMPLHWRRRWKRGFNQSELLARHVATHLGIPLFKAVKRTRATATQAGLTNSNRRKNVAGAFRATNGKRIAGKNLLLVDDVMTTGATASACARSLKRAGAASVTVLTVARADRRLAPYQVYSNQPTSNRRPASGEKTR